MSRSRPGSTNNFSPNPPKLGLLKPLIIFQRGKNYLDLNDKPKSLNPRFFPATLENYQSRLFHSFLSAQRGKQAPHDSNFCLTTEPARTEFFIPAKITKPKLSVSSEPLPDIIIFSPKFLQTPTPDTDTPSK